MIHTRRTGCPSSGTTPTAVTIGAAVLAAVLAVWWLMRNQAQWVRIAANAYARSLLEVCKSWKLRNLVSGLVLKRVRN